MSNARLVVGMGLCKTQSEENSVQAIVICIDHWTTPPPPKKNHVCRNEQTNLTQLTVITKLEYL